MVDDHDRAVLSRKTADVLLGDRESWTRKMFELAKELRKDGRPVHDLSLGNPSLEPPEAWKVAVHALVDSPKPGRHRYMTNAGFQWVRAFVAAREAERYGLPFEALDVTMTVGAAGALNVLFRAMLDPGDEVLVPSPYFSEYDHYCANVDAILRPVPSGPEFSLDPDSILRAIGPRTRVILLNSPNNPTGAIYSAGALAELARGLARSVSGRARPIHVIEDAPYRDLVYDPQAIPSMLEHWDDTILVTSHSKDLGLAGERIGYLLVSPRSSGRLLLRRASSFCNRVLGFVNAPALMQRALPKVLGSDEGRVDVSVYASNCKRMAEGLRELGFELPEPRAGFFLFPRLPAACRQLDEHGGDVAFNERLVQRRTIVVPGTAFGVPGHLRLALCVEPTTVESALEAFRAVCAEIPV